MKNNIFLINDEKDILGTAETGVFDKDLEIRYSESVGSTQDEAKKIADAAGGKSVVFVSEEQTGGRGRFGRAWESSKGGLWFSLTLVPDISPEKTIQLGLVSCVIIAKAIERLFSLKPLIKWPNDIIFEKKKLAGILTEASVSANTIKWVVLGVGLNVNNILSTALEKEAVSLRSLLNNRINRKVLLTELLKDFYAGYELFKKQGFKRFKNDFESRSALKDKEIVVEEGGSVYSGTVKGIDDDGFLRLISAQGNEKRVLGGTVSKYN